MDKIEFYQRLAAEKSTETLMIKLPAVLKEFVATQPNMSEYVKNLIIADYERQQAMPVKQLKSENDRLAAELAAAREALECTFNWAMTEESDPNGGFDIFVEDIVPMIGRVLGRE